MDELKYLKKQFQRIRNKILKEAIPTNATHLMAATALGTASKQVMMNG